jgi:transposase
MDTTKLRQKADFTNKNIFAGMDVHKKSWTISIYCEQDYLRTFTQPPQTEALVKLLHRDYPGGTYTCGYEAGFIGFWISRALNSQDIKCKVLHPADIPQTGKRKTIKRDSIDSKGIAQALAMDLVRSVHIPDSEVERDRTIIRYRQRLQQDIRRCKNRIQGLLFQFGIDTPANYRSSWSKKFIIWLKEIKPLLGSAGTTLDHMIGQLELLRKTLLEVNRSIRSMQESEKYHRQVDLLRTIPGIGSLSAITILTELDDIHRFSNFRQLNSYVGLYPMEYSSGETDRKGSITVRKNNFLRSLLIEVAWISIRHDPALIQVFQEWRLRMTAKRAIVKIARKLLSRIRFVLINESCYEKGIIK